MVLVAGGVGVAPMLSTAAVHGPAISLVWAVRDADVVAAAAPLLADFPHLAVQLHCTGALQGRALEGARSGRPDLRSILGAAREGGGRVAVLVCGPSAMIRDVRTIVRSEQPAVDWHSETFLL